MKYLIFVCSFLFVFSTTCFGQDKKLYERVRLEGQKVVLTIDVEKELIVLTNEDSLCINDNYNFLYAEVDIYIRTEQYDDVSHEYVGTVELNSFDFPIVEFEEDECINIIRLEIENKKTEEIILLMDLSIDLQLKG